MTESTPDHIQRPVEQPGATDPPEIAEAWDEFFRLGEALAASDTPASDTLTATVLAMRR